MRRPDGSRPLVRRLTVNVPRPDVTPPGAGRAREIELIALTMFAAIPLYATQVISIVPLAVFHAVMALIVARVLLGRRPDFIPLPLMRSIGILYVVFYIVDAVAISRSAISASTHLVLFIAAYQPMEAASRRNKAQRLLTASLIFVASLATSTHIAIVPFVIVFGFLLFRQLIHLSHQESVRAVHVTAAEPPASRAAAFYVVGTTAIGMLLFPVLPRVRNPLVPGIARGSDTTSTGLSDSINFNDQRTIANDATVVSRIWMGQEAIPFFTPLRLRGAVYERFQNNVWLQGRRDFVQLETDDGVTRVARPSGFTRRATVQQRFILGTRLFLPVGTFEVIGVPQIFEYPTHDIYTAWQSRGDIITYDVRLARETSPLEVGRVPVSNYPITPEVAAMAHRIVGDQTDPMKQATKIESYLSTHFQYVPDPAKIGHRMNVDEFLLREHRGHCEYFAAGMVALLTALGTPARIVGGFYGGKLNPLTGYFVLRREDAHAWVEAFDGNGWRTFDPTPASLRPGGMQTGLISAYASALSDSINYFWDRYILTFGLADQIALAAEVIADARDFVIGLNHSTRAAAVNLLKPRALAAAAAFALLAVITIWVANRRRPAFELLRDHLRERGIEIGPTMTMEEALEELRTKEPQIADSLGPLIALYEEERFSARLVPARERIRRRLAELRSHPVARAV
ncbi:MAG TPA: transglutaminaseTgpA domain-containing protein [Thermoanaerobaculia bacterium]|nr:transglutaminaseTgpA domain-containing protein [Thermoanaerobaculia bacterium]